MEAYSEADADRVLAHHHERGETSEVASEGEGAGPTTAWQWRATGSSSHTRLSKWWVTGIERQRAGLRDLRSSAQPCSRRLVRTAMKEGLLGGKLRLSSRTDLEEAHLHVARRTRSKSKEA